MSKKGSAEKTIRNIRRKTRRLYSSEEKIRIVLEGLRGEENIATLCRREGIVYLGLLKKYFAISEIRLRRHVVRGLTARVLLDGAWSARNNCSVITPTKFGK